MNPDVTLRSINDFLRHGLEGDEVDQWCQQLFDWLERGGAAPDWKAYPLAESYYRCREVHMKRESARCPNCYGEGDHHEDNCPDWQPGDGVDEEAENEQN